MQKLYPIFYALFFLTAIQCRENQNKENLQSSTENSTEHPIVFNYANTIDLKETDTTLDYIIKLDGEEKITHIDKNNLPLKNMIVLSSSSIGFLAELDQIPHIKAVYGAQWMYNTDLHKSIADETIKDLGNAAAINLEQILVLNPDAILAFSDPNQSKMYASLEDAGILVLYVDEYREDTPLGKAEFIKLYGALTSSKDKANAIFEKVENNYKKLKQQAEQTKNKPTVFAEIMRGDVWYMPGGDSFVANYFEDAGANYLWSEDDNQGSIPLNFEQVFAKAGNADIWLNAADVATLPQLEQAYKNHAWFDAYKKGEVYSIYKRHNQQGANDYFEQGTVRADWVLKDLIKICHPDILPDHELYFYQQLH